MITWSEETRKLSQLKPFEANPRKITDADLERLVEKIKTSGYHQRIRITHDNRIIGGHQRLKALKKCGYKEVAVLVPDAELTDEEYRREVIQDNLQDGSWDIEALAEWDIDQLNDWGLDTEALGLIVEEPEIEGLTDEDAVPDAPEDPVTREGDIWLLGDHRVMCGDSTDAGTVVLLMDGEKADQMVTDPPYNVAYEGKTKDALTIKNDEMSDAGFRSFLVDAFSAAFDNMKAGASFYIWHADSEGYNFRGAVFDCGEEVRQCLIWKKQTIVMGRQDYHWKHEPCLYGWKKGAGHLWVSERKQTTILEFDRPSCNDIHPTMKPVNLIEYQIKNNTKGSDVVLDLFLGSGSTLIAAHKTGRKCYGMELDPKYCDVIIKRWQEFTGLEAVHSETGKTYAIMAEERL